MARKTFISYKYSEAQELRDDIIDALGEGSKYYQGETSDSPDLTDFKTETIKEHLKDMIFDTSVTIVIVSPHMKKSNWIDWEIEYSLTANSRHGRTSKSNGVVGVIMKVDGGYDWIRTHKQGADGHRYFCDDSSKLYPIINNNRFNEKPKVYSCVRCKTVNDLTGSYVTLVTEDEFLADPDKYIENAYDKSQNITKYDIRKEK